MAGPIIPRPQASSLTGLEGLKTVLQGLLGIGTDRPVSVQPSPREVAPPDQPDYSFWNEPGAFESPFTSLAQTFGEYGKDPGSQLLSELGPNAMAMPGSLAAMAMAKMPAAHKFRMFLAAQLAQGADETQAVEKLSQWIPLSPKKLQHAIEGARSDLLKIVADTGGKAIDPSHYDQMIASGRQARQWYNEAIPMVQEVLPARPGEAIIENGLTARQLRALKVLAHFGTNTPPKRNYEEFMQVVPLLERTETNADLLKALPEAQINPYTPGYSGLIKTLEESEDPTRFLTGGRKIESYFHNLANKLRPGLFDQPVTPVTADRWHFRAAGFPTEMLTEEGEAVRLPSGQARSTNYLSNTAPLASSAYQIIEDFTTQAAQRAGLTPEEAQAAMWFTAKLQDALKQGQVMEQGHPFMQQHVLAQTLQNVDPADITVLARALKKLLKKSPEGATVNTAGENVFGTAQTAVGAYPERTLVMPNPTLDKFRSLVERNADVLFNKQGRPQPFTGLGGWQTTKPEQMAGVTIPPGTNVMDVDLLVPDRFKGAQGEAVGLAADQMGVYHLRPQVPVGIRNAPVTQFSDTGGTGGAKAELPPLYARQGLAQNPALPELVRGLVDRSESLSPQQQGLLGDIVARLERAGQLPAGSLVAYEAKIGRPVIQGIWPSPGQARAVKPQTVIERSAR